MADFIDIIDFSSKVYYVFMRLFAFWKLQVHHAINNLDNITR